MSENYYQIIVLGTVDERLTSIKESFFSRLKDFNIDTHFIRFVHSADYASRDPKYPTIVIYFGGDKSNTLQRWSHMFEQLKAYL